MPQNTNACCTGEMASAPASSSFVTVEALERLPCRHRGRDRSCSGRQYDGKQFERQTGPTQQPALLTYDHGAQGARQSTDHLDAECNACSIHHHSSTSILHCRATQCRSRRWQACTPGCGRVRLLSRTCRTPREQCLRSLASSALWKDARNHLRRAVHALQLEGAGSPQVLLRNLA